MCTLVGEPLLVEHVFDEHQEHAMTPFRGPRDDAKCREPQSLAYALARGTLHEMGLLAYSTESLSPPTQNA